MIGLEYVLNKFNKSNSELANELDISRQNITLWISQERPIPKKYLPVLSEKFRIPEEYFQKTLGEIDKLRIDNIKADNELEVKRITKSYIDENGEKVSVEREIVVGDTFEINNRSVKIKYLETLEKFRGLVDFEDSKNSTKNYVKMRKYEDLINLFYQILESNNNENFTYLLKRTLHAILYYFNEDKPILENLDVYQDSIFVQQLVKLFEKEIFLKENEARYWSGKNQMDNENGNGNK